MIKYIDFYRRYGLRKYESMLNFNYPLLDGFLLPKASIYHSLPMVNNDREVDPNDPMIVNHDGTKYCVNLTKLKVMEGFPTRNNTDPATVVRALEKKNRKLRRLRQMSSVDRDVNALLIYNYSALQQFYRYKVSFLNAYQQWHDIYATMCQTIIDLRTGGVDGKGDISTREHFIKFELPKAFPTVGEIKLAAASLTRESAVRFSTPASLMLLDMWKWAGGHESVLGRLSDEDLRNVNLVFVDGNRVAVVNMAKLQEWRKTANREPDKEDQEDEEFMSEVEAKNLTAKKMQRGLTPTVKKEKKENHSKVEEFQRKLLYFIIAMAKTRSVNKQAEVQDDEMLEAQAATGEDDEVETVVVKKPKRRTDVDLGDLFNDDDEDLGEKTDAPDVKVFAIPDVEPVVNAPETTIPTEDELFDDSLFEVIAPEVDTVAEETARKKSRIDILSDPSAGVKQRVQALQERGMLSYAEANRFNRLSEKYKTIPNPFGEGTLEDLCKIDPADLKFEDDGVSTLNEFTSKYVEKVLHRDIANAIMTIQRGGVAVVDVRVERVIDAVNKYDIIDIKVAPVTGSTSTLRAVIPKFEPDGTWKADNARYYLRTQRGDSPIHKTKPTQVALTSYDGKLFVNRSTKAVNDFDRWLQGRIIEAYLNPEEAITELKYRSGTIKHAEVKLPRIYTALGNRFNEIKTDTLSLYLRYSEREKYFGESAMALEQGGMVLVGKAGRALLLVDNNDTFYRYQNGKFEVYGDVGDVLQFDTQKAPIETVELKVLGKSMPVGMILSYYMGIDALIERCGVTPRRLQKGMRLNLEKDEFAIRFFDQTLVFSRRDQIATMLFSGFLPFHRQIANFSYKEFNSKDVYLNAIEGRGLGIRQLRALDNWELYFIDPITLELLEEDGEPTTFDGLLWRSTELLTRDYVPKVSDRYRGYERVAGALYRELSRSMKMYRNKPVTSKASVELNPNAVWLAVQTDPANGLVEDSNAINFLKEQEAVTFGGTGGRSSRAMVRSTRAFDAADFGVISEATKDSSDVAISTYFSANPNLTGLRGRIRAFDPEKDGLDSIISTSALMAPSALNDDPKRVNFINIQNSSTIAAEGYTHSPFQTGYDQKMVKRLGKLYAYAAKKDGKVIELSSKHLMVEFPDGTRDAVELGRRFGVAAGSVIPHRIATDVVVGQEFKKGDVLAWNTGFFVRNRFDKTKVLAKVGVLVRTVIEDSSDTHEDSTAIHISVNPKLKSKSTEVRDIFARNEQTITNLVKVGDVLEPDSILCVIEDPLTANTGLFNDLSLDTLRLHAAQTPKSKAKGVVEHIEVLYRGDKEDMSPSLAEIANYYDKQRASLVRKLKSDESTTGEVIDRVRIGGTPLEFNSLAIRVYITYDADAGVGDKYVYANQMKTICGRVILGVFKTESGRPLGAKFGMFSLFNRIVNSPFKYGTTNSLLLHGSKLGASIYRGK